MYGKMKQHLSQTLAEIREAGLYKEERLIESPQRAAIQVKGKEVLNFCANNYLGLSDNPRLIEGATNMMQKRGFGMSSVRLICGTQDIHKQLEAAIRGGRKDKSAPRLKAKLNTQTLDAKIGNELSATTGKLVLEAAARYNARDRKSVV